MKKRFVATLLCVIMVLALIPGVASAKGNDSGVQNQRYYPGFSIVNSIREYFQQKTLERMVNQANVRIEQLVEKAQKTPWNDVPRLLFEVDCIVKGVFGYADMIGAELECVYVEYYIDGQYVLIDPIRIIRL